MNKYVNPVKGKYWIENKYLDPHFALYHNAHLCGVNIGVADTTDAVSIRAGLVVYVGTPSPYLGRTVVVQFNTSEGNTMHFRYAHLDTTNVMVGDKLAAGDLVGTFGEGLNNSNIKYLHFGMLYNISPTDWFPTCDDSFTLEGERIVWAKALTVDPQAYLEELGVVL